MIIKIKNLVVTAIIGIHDWERTTPRNIIINLELEFDGIKASKTDNINDTLNYDSISQIITMEVQKTNFGLIEKLAVHLLYKIMEDQRINYAKIEVDKPGAVANAASVSVIEEIKRNVR